MADIGRENGGVFLKFLLIPNTAMQVSQLQNVSIKKYTIHSNNFLSEINQIMYLIRNLRLNKKAMIINISYSYRLQYSLYNSTRLYSRGIAVSQRVVVQAPSQKKQ